ncbi:MAG: hypothetical protein RJA36_789 [Pseudomonadota bacterium]|jgi:DNA recombination-dependent growth factor C
MQSTLRRSGTFAAFLLPPKHRIEPGEPAFAAALARCRFRTIENAADEAVSSGWVTPEDPSGDTHAIEDMDTGGGIWLRLRIDTKKLPASQLAMHLAAAKRAKGLALNARERRELKHDLLEKLMPRVLPKTTNVDGLLFVTKDRAIVFSGSKSHREAFAKAFRESFGVELQPLGPREVALDRLERSDAKAIEELHPVRWSQAGRTA